jgi:hypothetical protein
MTRRFQGLLAAAAAGTLALTTAAAQTKMVSTEGQKAEQAPPRKILVVTVVDDATSRALFEDVIAGEVSLRGGNAAASHLSFPDLPNPKERGPFEAKLRELGVDAVLVSRLVSSEDKVKMTEGYETYATEYQGMDWWGGYVYTCEKVFVPGYLQKEKRVRVRSDLWRASEGKGRLIWTGMSQTMNPRTATQAGREVGASIANALAKKKLI